MISNWLIVILFLGVLILPVLLPINFCGVDIWKTDDTLSDKLFKTSRVSVLITALFTFLFSIKPVYDFEYLEGENSKLKSENKSLISTNKLLITKNNQLDQQKSLIENDVSVLQDSLHEMSYELIKLKRTKYELNSINTILGEENQLLSNQQDSLLHWKKNLEARIVNLENTVYLSHMNTVVKEIVDFKRSKHGFKEGINFHSVINDFFERNPIKSIDKSDDRNYYENESKRIFEEYSNTIADEEVYTITLVYESISYFLDKYYKI